MTLPAALPFYLDFTPIPPGGGPVPLPGGTVPTPFVFAPLDALTNSRVTRFRFDLLDRFENLIGEVRSVQGGAVEWSAFVAVKGGGTMNVRDIGQNIDWLNSRIRPVAVVSSVGAEEAVEVPLGVFLPAAPSEAWDASGRQWDVELADKLSILDTDIPTTAAGQPVSYTAPKGANVIGLVRALILGVGEQCPAIEPAAITLDNAQVWDTGTSRLEIINDLLETIGYASLWCDGQGQYQCQPNVPPADRTPVYEASAPFSKGEWSVMSPEWGRDRNIYDIPNRYVCLAQGDGDTEGLVGFAVNIDPASPYSYPSRGDRWITRTIDGVEANSVATLNARAFQGLQQATAITAGITAHHLFLPDLLINSTVRFVNPDAGADYLCYVGKTSVPFDPIALCTSELREAIE